MTQPDELLPERAANYSSLETFAGTTEEQWEDQIWGAEEDRWGINGLLGALFNGLEQGVSFVTALIGGIFEAVFDGVSFVATTIGDALTALGSAFGIRFTQISDAQYAAGFANSQTATITTSAFAAAVENGVNVVADFNEAAANTLTGFTRVLSDGAGAGFFGPDGNGRAVWKKSGGNTRRHIDRFNTQLASDTQAVLTVMLIPVQDPFLGGDAYTYLIGRMNSDGSQFVYARIGNNDAAIGKYASGTFTEWTTEDIVKADGDLWMFLLGTTANAREFVLKQNGITRVSWTDTSGSSLGELFRYVGLGALAAPRALLDQTVPGVLELWTAADREPGSSDLKDLSDLFGLGARGSLWYTGASAPSAISGAQANDLFLNTSNGDIYVFG